MIIKFLKAILQIDSEFLQILKVTNLRKKNDNT